MNITFSGYKVIRQLGKGASASVHLAVQENLNRRVAIKVMRHQYSDDENFSLRFKREGRIIAQLTHPHIVPVYDVGENEDNLYMSMEYLPGKDLREKSKELTVQQALGYLIDLATALNYAHGKGYVHRDVKPENILFRANGEIVLTDFGIARPAESLTHMTVTGVLMGTPSYMSPEQIDGRELDGRSDLYALGAILFEMLTGHVPYQSDSIVNVGLQHLTADIPTLPKSTSKLQDLINTLLAKEPSDRPKSGIELVQLLRKRLQTLDKTLLETRLPAMWSDAPEQKAYMSEMLFKPKRRHWSFWLAPLVFISIAALGYFQFSQNTLTDTSSANTTPEKKVENIPLKTEEPELVPWQEELVQAERLREEGVLWSEQGNGALTLYRRVLEADPDNIVASNAVLMILTQFSSDVDNAIYEADYDLAENLIEQMTLIWPDSERVVQLRDKLQDSVTLAQQESLRQEAQAKQQRINSLLVKSRQAILQNQYTNPAEQNALFFYRQVLAIEPQNQLANQGIDLLKTDLLTDAKRFIDANDFNQADSALMQVNLIESDSDELVAIRQLLFERKGAFEAQKIAADQLAVLNAQITLLNDKTYQWQQREEDQAQLIESGNSLLEEIGTLAKQAPENVQLLTLRQNVQTRLTQLNERKPEAKRFKVSGF